MYRDFFKLIVVSLVLFPTEANEEKNCNRFCKNNKIPIHYPFGFSENCKIQLNCSQNGDVLLANRYKVKNITSDAIRIDFPANCSRKIGEIRELEGHNYAMTWQNSLMLGNCTEKSQQPLSGCMLPERMIKTRFGSAHNACLEHEKLRCYSDSSSNFTNMLALEGTRCGMAVGSYVVDMGDSERGDVAGSVRFHVVDLEWWVTGAGNCSGEAHRVAVSVPNGNKGFRCRCREGSRGDGFVDGNGCVKASSASRSNRVRILVGVSSGIAFGALLLTVLVLIYYFIRRKSRSSKKQTTAKRILNEATGRSDVPFFSYKEIERATNGFSDNQRLGTGAYGTVYAGKLHNDEWVAIKKIRHRDREGVEQVINEIKLLSFVSHPNLVRLLGCCIENNEQILVYEYMPNGTLCQHLQREKGTVLPWTVRLSIATETAQAIAYLHSAMNPPIYHRDIKSSNILLDYNFNSKVADFGLSRLGLAEDSHISTAPQGTPGYVDPQYHQNYHLSDKSDVYSFGVVLVEIITALKAVDFSRPNSEVNLAALAIERIGKGHMDEIIDRYLEPNRDAWTLSSIYKVAELAFRCLAFHRDMRPSMNEVADELEQVRLSGWAPLEENICTGSLVTSSCSSSFNVSERSTGGISMKKSGMGSRRSVLSQRVVESLTSFQEVKDCSPISVQEHWPSEHSSPSSNSLLGKMVR